jgi:hypothetical protein
MYKFTGIFLLMVLSAYSQAVQDNYWVLGSYANETNAILARQRVSDLLVTDVLIRHYKGKNLYRLVVPQANLDREMLNAKQIDAWLMPMESEPSLQLSKDEATPQLTEKSKSVLKAVYVEPATKESPRPLYPAFHSGENIIKYCERLPSSELCIHPTMSMLLDKQRHLTEKTKALDDYCETLTGEAELQVCKRWISDSN